MGLLRDLLRDLFGCLTLKQLEAISHTCSCKWKQEISAGNVMSLVARNHIVIQVNCILYAHVNQYSTKAHLRNKLGKSLHVGSTLMEGGNVLQYISFLRFPFSLHLYGWRPFPFSIEIHHFSFNHYECLSLWCLSCVLFFFVWSYMIF